MSKEMKEKKEKKIKNSNTKFGIRATAAILAVLMVFSMCITPVAYLISILSNK